MLTLYSPRLNSCSPISGVSGPGAKASHYVIPSVRPRLLRGSFVKKPIPKTGRFLRSEVEESALSLPLSRNPCIFASFAFQKART